ncbi:hypothetical protein [Bacillus sp. FSL R5-0447]|uniref:hypothetical protein n=1 Tax=Bacillus TaxID=1386 RepID=UPI00315AECDA
MNHLEFISSLVNSMIWPVTLIISILMLKGPLSERLKDLISLKYGNLEMVFNSAISKAESYIKMEQGQAGHEQETVRKRFNELQQLSKISTIDAVIDTWEFIKEIIKNKANENGIEAGNYEHFYNVLNKLENEKVMKGQTRDSVIALYNARKILLKGNSITESAAEKFIAVARIIANRIVKEKPSK